LEYQRCLICIAYVCDLRFFHLRPTILYGLRLATERGPQTS
jgi:hypothetical protein